MASEHELFNNTRQQNRFEWVSGNAIIKDGIPALCAVHNIPLTLDTPFPRAARLLICPHGDTLYLVTDAKINNP